MRLVKALATARFDESVDIAVQLGVDPRKAGENIRGTAQLPFGTGKSVRIAVFARGEKAREAQAAGADVVGAEDLVTQIQSGQMAFEKVIATPDMMALVGRVGRILGPRGLMPNPKLGTVTQDVTAAVTAAKRGQVSFRVDKSGILHAPLGRVSFPEKKLLANLRSLMLAVNDLKPDGLKGTYIRHATVSSTMGRGVHLDPTTIDPARPRFGHTSDMYKAVTDSAASAPGSATLLPPPLVLLDVAKTAEALARA